VNIQGLFGYQRALPESASHACAAETVEPYDPPIKEIGMLIYPHSGPATVLGSRGPIRSRTASSLGVTHFNLHASGLHVMQVSRRLPVGRSILRSYIYWADVWKMS